MSRILQDEKLVSPVLQGSNIGLVSGGVVNIGGRQFITDQVASVPLPSMAANQRYQVYAVYENGAPKLVVSQNDNSAGPASYSTWKLVGAFYSNGITASVDFGSFINIEGVPTTDDIPATPLLEASTTNPTLGSGGNFQQEATWARVGDRMICQFVFRFGTAGVSAGSGAYELPLFGFNRKLFVGASFNVKGSVQLYDVGTNTNYPCMVSGFAALASDRVRFGRSNGVTTSITVTQAAPFGWGVDDILRGEFEASIQEWGNTPIKDL